MNKSESRAVLIIGAGPMQVLIGNQAKSLGLKVYLSDKNLEAVGSTVFDGFYNVSGDDIPALLDVAKDINRTNNLIGVYCGSDFCLKALSEIHCAYDLFGPTQDSVNLSLDKYKSKLKWKKLKIRTPSVTRINSIEKINESNIHFPMVVKPLDSCGSQGVTLVNNNIEFNKAFKIAKNYSNDVLIENYYPGFGVDVIGIIWDGVFYPQGIGDRHFSDLPNFYPIWGCYPTVLSRKDIEDAYSITRDACLGLGLNFTPVKADLLYFNGEFVLLEVTPRFHGDVFTTLLVPNATGYYPSLEWFRCLINQLPLCNPNNESKASIWIGVYPKVNFHVNEFRKTLLLFLCELNATLDHFSIDESLIDKSTKNDLRHSDTSSLSGFLIITLPKKSNPSEFFDLYKKALGDFV